MLKLVELAHTLWMLRYGRVFGGNAKVTFFCSPEFAYKISHHVVLAFSLSLSLSL